MDVEEDKNISLQFQQNNYSPNKSKVRRVRNEKRNRTEFMPIDDCLDVPCDLKRLRHEVQSMVISGESPFIQNNNNNNKSQPQIFFQNPCQDPRADFRIVIRVRTLTGRVIEIDASVLETVRDLKERILIREGIPISNQRLVFNGKTISDPQVLDMYVNILIRKNNITCNIVSNIII
jgi:hypothetical protein